MNPGHFISVRSSFDGAAHQFRRFVVVVPSFGNPSCNHQARTIAAGSAASLAGMVAPLRQALLRLLGAIQVAGSRRAHTDGEPDDLVVASPPGAFAPTQSVGHWPIVSVKRIAGRDVIPGFAVFRIG